MKRAEKIILAGNVAEKVGLLLWLPGATDQRSVVTGFNKGVFLDPSDLAMFNGGQVEIANSCYYCVGNVRSVAIKKEEFNIKMHESIFGRGHPPPLWKEASLGGEFLDELNNYRFAYIGTGGNGGGNRLFIQSVYYNRCGPWSITLFPPDRKFLDPFTIDNLKAMRRGSTSVTVLPQDDEENSSKWWVRPKPLPEECGRGLPLSLSFA